MNLKKSGLCICKLIHFAVHLILTQHCKSTIIQQKFQKTGGAGMLFWSEYMGNIIDMSMYEKRTGYIGKH